MRFVKTRRRLLLSAVGVLAATVAAVAVPALAQAEPASDRVSLTGSGVLDSIPTATLTFEFDAHGRAGHETDAKGTFTVRHQEDGNDMWAVSEVTCLQVGGPVATVTGVVVTSNEPRAIGGVSGFSVYDDPDGADRLGASWSVGFSGEVPPCMSTAPIEELREGGYTVRN